MGFGLFGMVAGVGFGLSGVAAGGSGTTDGSLMMVVFPGVKVVEITGGGVEAGLEAGVEAGGVSGVDATCR